MFVNYAQTKLRRRGVVLVLILGMLGLLALIGVTFATFSGQAKVNARNFSQSQNRPNSTEVMDFALSQLIDDTGNPQSAIRGHSLKRDMYGNDAAYNGSLNAKPSDGSPMHVSSAAAIDVDLLKKSGTINVKGLYRVQTDIVVGDPGFYGYDFTRWILRFGPKVGPDPVTGAANSNYYVGTTYEIVCDDLDDTSGFRVFYVKNADHSASTTTIKNMPSIVGSFDQANGYASPETGVTQSSGFSLDLLIASVGGATFNTAFTLDGRYLHAFNGPGMEGLAAYIANIVGDPNVLNYQGYSRYANFRVNGNLVNGNFALGADSTPIYGDPSNVLFPGMDEDYDACDLENWFLSLQSADGQVVIPSFHRPGILINDPTANDPITGTAGYDDWTSSYILSQAKILRPRAADGHDAMTFPNLYPNATTGKIDYDVDNDADGVTDSVWLDLGYPSRRNTEGQLYKPLFAFMVIGLNGKIPLNTAGNLQLRDLNGNPRYQHASHLGYSPSEIDPSYALQNYYDHGTLLDVTRPELGTSTYSQVDNASITTTAHDVPMYANLTQLRNILAGTHPQQSTGGVLLNNDRNYVMVNGQQVYLPNNVADQGDNPPNGGGMSGSVSTTVPPVAGRWGEPSAIPSFLPGIDIAATNYNYSNAVRAGLSGLGTYSDNRDDNFNAFDPYQLVASPTFNGELGDFYDASGSIALSVERMRRFVTPLDISGTGLVTTFNYHKSIMGPDRYGRVNYLQYFRPEGVAGATAAYPGPPLIKEGTPVIPDLRNNLYHGYESYRVATNTYGGSTLPNWLLATMPFNTTTSVTALPTITPTYDVNLNSAGLPTYSPIGLDDADEMNLYQASSRDQPFSYSDLEWLYRYQDSDGTSLQSRLSSLAPVSFLNPGDGQRRRRMFGVDTWEPTNFVWANDNPYNLFATNATFNPTASANATNVVTTVPAIPATIPSIAHRDRRINLNFPLPVSNSPSEPIRQKWIRETYQLLKLILPPKAVDTPQELAQLSQFVVNIIDFRDPDGTCTKFVNTDLVVTPATTTNPPVLTVRPITTPLTPLTAGGPTPPSYAVQYTESNSTYLIQYGMEYNPVALNEVLAYQFDTHGASNGTVQPARRMFVEMVNTLTQDGGSGVTSDLLLDGWDMVILPDTPQGRPDPYTGQIPVQTVVTAVRPIAMNGTAVTATVNKTANTPLTIPIPALQGPRVTGGTTTTGDSRPNYYYVTGITPPNQTTPAPTGTFPVDSSGAGTGVVNIASQIDFINNSILQDTTSSPANRYYWLYLRRPANPFDASYDPTKPFENRIVADSFRFMLNYAPVTNVTYDSTQDTETVTADTGAYLYSLQRMQPFRGGHAVPPVVGDTTIAPAPPASYSMPAYGYSEQTICPYNGSGSTVTNLTGLFAAKQGTNPRVQMATTGDIKHTLGKANTNNVAGAGTAAQADSNWDQFPFHDRDFASVAELVLVPGCPPGLFTKQFLDVPPPWNTYAGSGALATPPVVTTNTSTSTAFPVSPGFATAGTGFATWPVTAPLAPPRITASTAPRSYPYLRDNFFYTAQSERTWPAPATGPAPVDLPSGNYVGGPSGAGWHKMLEFFEVPSPALGAIGEVATGTNYDWARQDLRPGLLNLNLIIDEEVYFSLMSESWLKNYNNPGDVRGITVNNLDRYGDTRLNVSQLNPALGTLPHFPPAIVTQVDATGTPRSSYLMPNVGFYALDSIPGSAGYDNRMKAAFSDFIKLRHGGSGYAFAYGLGVSGQVPYNSIAGSGNTGHELPFHALSYPDIDFTVMRPATLSPTPSGFAGVSSLTPIGTAEPTAFAWSPSPTRVADPGLKNPSFFTQNSPVQPPAIPAHRLFQIPDSGQSNANITGLPTVNTTTTNSVLMSANADQTAADTPTNITSPPAAAAINTSYHLGGGGHLSPYAGVASPVAAPIAPITGTIGPDSATGAVPVDRRQTPFFRTEWLQKVTNLTTVRTHQYAVWITVGFFEVLDQGDPLLGNTSAMLATDKLGPEIGLAQGENIRFRSFFVIDRTKAFGFSQQLSSNFRDCVLYRQAIE